MGKHTDVNQRTRRKKTETEKQETARKKALQAETIRVAAQEAEQEARRQFFGTDRTGSAEQAESSTATVPPLPPQPAQSHSLASAWSVPTRCADWSVPTRPARCGTVTEAAWTRPRGGREAEAPMPTLCSS